MSLLDQGRETVLVFLEEEYVSRDGNVMTRASSVGIETRATVHPAAQSGTSSRLTETDVEGFMSETAYRLRFPRNFPHVLGMQSQIEWRGVRWSLVGKPLKFNGSPRTARYEYTIRRS